jgi:lysophospholipase L1-like esterase
MLYDFNTGPNERPSLSALSRTPRLWSATGNLQIMRDLDGNVLTLHLTVLGDSLGYGTGASSPSNGFTQIVYRALTRHANEHSFTNLSVPGATMNDVAMFQVSHIPAEVDALLLVVGANDVPNTSDPAIFIEQYGRLLGRIRSSAPLAELFVTGVPNIGLTPHVPEEAKPFVESLCASLSESMREQATTHQATFIDLFTITNLARGHGLRYLAEDSFHPSDRGYALMARGALPVIQAVLRASAAAEDTDEITGA